MTKTLVTGATGLVGWNIVQALRERGRAVRALVRDPDKARRLLPAEVELVAGDVTDRPSVERALADVKVVYHAAGLPEQWLKDAGRFQRVNVEGTRNLVEASLERKVERFVYTSTIDVFQAGPSQEFDESSPIDPAPKGTAYERSKQDADRLVVAAIERGLHAVFLHPAALYGPGPAGSPGINDFIVRLEKRQIPALLPGGMPVVHSRDVGLVHVLAEDRPAGSRYILSESYVEITHLAWIVSHALGRKDIPRVMPLWLAKVVSEAGERWAGVSSRPPLIPRGQLHFLQWKARPKNTKARKELKWTPTLFRDGVRTTVAELTGKPLAAATSQPT